MKKLAIIGLIVLCAFSIPFAAHAETYWSFGFGASSYSFGGYFGGGYYGSTCAVPYQPVVPAVPYGCSTTVVIGGPTTCAPYPYYYHPYYNNWFDGCGFYSNTYYYGGAYHPGPPPVHWYHHHHHYHYHHPHYRQRIHINNCNNCNIYGGRHRRYP